MDISYSELRRNLKKNMCVAAENHETMFVTSHKKRVVVLLSYDDYLSLEETSYLLRSPVMANRLLEAISDVNSGKIVEHGLIDEA